MKTRLAKAIGSEPACRAYCDLVGLLLGRLSTLPEVELRFAPDDALQEIKQWQAPSWSLAHQGSGDLGTRLENAFAHAFDQGAQRVIIIGSDCPGVTVADLQEAWDALKDRDLVLGPARDGGYWLIGLRQNQPEVFNNIPWSTEMVLRATLERAKTLGLQCKLLRVLADVDTLADWQEFLASENFVTHKPAPIQAKPQRVNSKRRLRRRASQRMSNSK